MTELWRRSSAAARRHATTCAKAAKRASTGLVRATRAGWQRTRAATAVGVRRLGALEQATLKTLLQLKQLNLRQRLAAVRVSLQTRVLLVLVSIAAASTVFSGLLHDSSLASDLDRAANARLTDAAAAAEQLASEHLAAQVERCRAIATTPQFLANVEARHTPTLVHYARELAAAHGAAAVLFLDRDGSEIAGAGDEGLRRRLLRHLAAEGPVTPAPQAPTVATYLAHAGTAYAAAGVPLLDHGRQRGSLVMLVATGERELAAWSRVCRTHVWLGTSAPGGDPSLLVRGIDDLELRVSIAGDVERDALANSRWKLLLGGLVGIALASLASFFLARSLVRPICAIQVAAERVRAGDFDFVLDEGRSDEVGDVARAFNSMRESLRQNIDHRKEVEHQISHQARHDSLTGLGNRRLFRDRLAQTLEKAKSGSGRVGLIFVDIDRFKDVNDTLGHAAGDELLVQVAQRLRACIGEGGDGALVARLSSDEFTVVLGDVEDRCQLADVAERLLAALAVPYTVRDRELTLSASLGIAVCPDDGTDVDALLSESDLAMQQAKNQGGGSYEFYSDSMQETVARRIDLDNGLRTALENGEFTLFYQPKVDLGTNQVTGMEALLRWNHPTYGLVGPSEFIPRIEETGAIVPIGAWALRTAMQQAVQWQRVRPMPVRVAVNVSGRQIQQGDEFIDTVATLLESTRLEPSLLELEITEGVLLDDPEAAIAVLKRLKEMGICLSLDDFGTGYSSLSQLRQLPIDTLKLDRSFICGVDTDPDATALIGSIIAMAKVVELRVVVEGVETSKQRRLLEQLGCEEIQGYLIGKPMPAAEATAMLRTKRRRRLPPDEVTEQLAGTSH